MFKVSFEGKYLKLDRGSEGSWLLDRGEQRVLLDTLVQNSMIDPTGLIGLLGGSEFLDERARNFKNLSTGLRKLEKEKCRYLKTQKNIKGG
jgi:hypothetical protein